MLRVGRLLADLEFRSRASSEDADLPGTLSLVQRELLKVDANITQRYFGGAQAATRLMTA